MKCLRCGNTEYFTSFFNQNIKIKLSGSKIRYVKKSRPEITDIYPVICQKCQNGDVDFNYKELDRIIFAAAGRRYPAPQKYGKPLE